MQSAILLLGPTSSGKTPLGRYLETHPLWGRRCLHFDFGERLRGVAEGRIETPGLTKQDIQTVVHVVTSNALLENSQFHIAAALLRTFFAEHKIDGEDILVLNGLPRHVDQARDSENLVRIRLVLVLDCPAEVVRERIRRDSGGDRTGRMDDSEEEVRKKLLFYRARTEPLIDYYAGRHVPMHRLVVAVESQPGDHFASLEKEPELARILGYGNISPDAK